MINQVIEVENISLLERLNKVSCAIPQGKLIGIMGANGAGKSTLLKAMAGVLPLTSGEIRLKNCKLSELSPIQKSEQLAYLAQSVQIHWDLTVYEVIALGLLYPLKPTEEQTKVRSVSELFSILHLLEKPYRQLSGGEKARVQLARCCIKNAPILLADEPIASLDPYYQIDIMQQLKALTPERTCVVVLHHLDLAYRFCDEVILLDQGNIIAGGETQTVLNGENLAKAFKIKAEIDPIARGISRVEKI